MSAEPVVVSIADRVAKAARATLPDQADHFEIATAFLDRLAAEHGAPAVFAFGSLWVLDDNLWSAVDLPRAAVMVGEWFGGLRYCRRAGDFDAIVRVAAGISADARFFERAAVNWA